MDEIDIAVLDMSAFEFKIECSVAYKHKGEGVEMHRGPSDATHIVYSVCGYCQRQSAEAYVCLDFIKEAFSDDNTLEWRCAPCRSLNRYPTTLKIVGTLF